jgi:hypothetical protein
MIGLDLTKFYHNLNNWIEYIHNDNNKMVVLRLKSIGVLL